MRTLTFTSGALAVALLFSTPAAATVPVVGTGYSIGYGIAWVEGLLADPDDTWSWWIDPPANVLSGQVIIHYDPSMFTVLPDASGPAGLFSNDPSSAPAVNPSEFYGSFTVPALPGARPGDVWNLDLSTAGIAIISFDLTANPVSLDPSAGDVNMYALTVRSARQLRGFTVNNTPTGDMVEDLNPSSTFMTCAAPTGGANFPCGEPTNATFSQGLTAIAIPEPGTWAVMLLGFGGLGLAIRRRRKSAAFA